LWRLLGCCIRRSPRLSANAGTDRPRRTNCTKCPIKRACKYILSSIASQRVTSCGHWCGNYSDKDSLYRAISQINAQKSTSWAALLSIRDAGPYCGLLPAQRGWRAMLGVNTRLLHVSGFEELTLPSFRPMPARLLARCTLGCPSNPTAVPRSTSALYVKHKTELRMNASL